MSEFGQIEQGIVKQAIRSNQPIPERILNAPQLEEHLAFYFQAWLDLNTERPCGFVIQRIPWSSVVRYARFYRCSQDETDTLLHIIREVDAEHIKKWQAEQSK